MRLARPPRRRRAILAALLALAPLGAAVGCAGPAGGASADPYAGNADDAIEVRTHRLAPWMAADLPGWAETIRTTVAPENWNAPDSPHRLSHDANVLTVRTTHKNQEAIIAYLAQAMRKYAA